MSLNALAFNPKLVAARRVRACRPGDLPAVAALYESVARSGSDRPPPHLADYFARTFFDHPWAEADIPPLVYEDKDGAILGFLGQHARRLRYGARQLRLAYGGQLVVAPQARSRAVGALLFREHLQGAQDATLTDGANDMVRGMWAVCRGETAQLRSMTWTRVFRPLEWAAHHALRRLQRASLARPLRALCRPLDRLALGLAGSRLQPRDPGTTPEVLTVEAFLEYLPVLGDTGGRLAYDEAYLSWLFREMAQVKSRGKLVRSIVRRRGQFLGWYVYYLCDGISQVLQVAARRGEAGTVLDSLFFHAQTNGACALQGRLEPQLAEALARRRCLFGWSGGALLHARDAAVLGALVSGDCWLSRMDGEWWMGHHTEAFS